MTEAIIPDHPLTDNRTPIARSTFSKVSSVILPHLVKRLPLDLASN
ncbi:MAG: hypothetical protein ABJF89_07715 [Parasphingorhabdus sp.]